MSSPSFGFNSIGSVQNQMLIVILRASPSDAIAQRVRRIVRRQISRLRQRIERRPRIVSGQTCKLFRQPLVEPYGNFHL